MFTNSLINGTIIGLAIILFGVAVNKSVRVVGVDPPQLENRAADSLDRSSAALDRLITNSEMLNSTSEKIIHNQEAIFRKLTGCISDETCEAMKRSTIEQP